MADEPNPFEQPPTEAPDPFAKTDELSPTPLVEVLATEEVKEEVKPVEVVEPIKLGVKETARQRILEEYGGKESDIPVNSAYWTMR